MDRKDENGADDGDQPNQKDLGDSLLARNDFVAEDQPGGDPVGREQGRKEKSDNCVFHNGRSS